MNTNIPTANSSYDSSAVSETIESFVESTTALANALDAPESIVSEFQSSAEELGELVAKTAHESNQAAQQANDNSDEIQSNSDDLDELQNHTGKERAKLSGRIAKVEQDIEDSNPTPQADQTTIQQEDLTPIEQLSQSDEIEDVTDSKSVRRAVSLFKNLPRWGSKTPKGIVLKPADNPLSLLEADRDESLCWKQYYRAAETLEQLSQGSVTFFDSDRHGKMICLHEQSEAYQRVVNGSLSTSSVEATG